MRRNADDFDLAALGAATRSGHPESLPAAARNHRIPAGDYDAEVHARGGEIAFDGHRLALDRICPSPKRKLKTRFRARR